MSKLKVVQWENKNFFLVRANIHSKCVNANGGPYTCTDCYFTNHCCLDIPCKPGYFLKECLPIHYLLQEIEENEK